jgi:glycosyltransferase involved in cell wall biosynthesis
MASGQAEQTSAISIQNKTLRVLHVINGEHYSGAERVQDLLGLCLPKLGVEVGFACVKPGKFLEARQATECPVYDASMQSRLDMRAAWRLAQTIRAEQYELVHAHTPRSLMVGRLAAAFCGVPVVYHVHSPTSRDTTHSLRNWLNSATERFSLAGVSRLVCVSQSLLTHMRACGWREELLRVVPNGVPSGPELLPRNTPDRTWTLSMVALFRPRKGLEILLQAIAELRSQGYSVRLRAIGPFETPAYEASIQELVTKLKIAELIDWLGFTRDVNAELTQTDLFVLPSLFGEGLPMVVLEAMAAGVPVISTAVEGVPEALRDGLDGLLARPDDAPDLARAIRRIMDREVDWQTLRTSARTRQVAHFSDHSMASGVAQIYRELL